MTGFPDKPTRLTTALLAGIAGAAGLGGALPIYAPDKGRRNEARAAAFKARQRKKRKRK